MRVRCHDDDGYENDNVGDNDGAVAAPIDYSDDGDLVVDDDDAAGDGNDAAANDDHDDNRDGYAVSDHGGDGVAADDGKYDDTDDDVAVAAADDDDDNYDDDESLAVPPATPELGTTEGGEDSVQDDNDNVGGSSEGSDDESGSEPLIAVTGALPSIGSALHASGKCSRCCFYLKVNGEPVGRILEENVLSQTDCDLLSFAGSSALVAVRWLLYLGANAEVADGNNTSALHAADGSAAGNSGLGLQFADVRPALHLPGVPMEQLRKQFIKQTALLNSQDVAGWTPLHIAAHMGRKAVALRLLQAGGQLETAASATSHPRRHHHYRYQKYRAHRSIADANADASNDCTVI
eukprot:s1295_g10.t1